MADPFLNYFALGLLFFVVAVLFFALSRRALKAGAALAHLVPDAGHLVRMLTHIDVLCGDCQSVVEA